MRACAYLRPLAGLEATVGVDPQQLLVATQQTDIQEGLDLLLNEVHPAQGASHIYTLRTEKPEYTSSVAAFEQALFGAKRMQEMRRPKSPM